MPDLHNPQLKRTMGLGKEEIDERFSSRRRRGNEAKQREEGGKGPPDAYF